MADFKFGDGIKTIILAGVGAVAYSAEKGQEIIGELVKKGEITVEQGKDLSSDLQRSFKESMGKRGIDIDEISEKVSKMSSEELAKIKEQLANAEKLVSDLKRSKRRLARKQLRRPQRKRRLRSLPKRRLRHLPRKKKKRLLNKR